ncbi:hypothetical protein PIB30_088328 [Stylosanthes scabra]|uniref:Replication factor A C-terminal domain-containing protein n=1 Tax=Stylosanthes scabra TaxID=79078 RepID=A0ABU6SUJ4_9FABA|nr:hypothetical protein [Stylosanthes scabra]
MTHMELILQDSKCARVKGRVAKGRADLNNLVISITLFYKKCSLGIAGHPTSSRISHVSSHSAASAAEDVLNAQQACGKCGKKVETTPTGRYECKECHHTDEGPNYKYNVQVLVYDGTACIIILLWNTYVIQLCGKSAADLLKETERTTNVSYVSQKCLKKAIMK